MECEFEKVTYYITDHTGWRLMQENGYGKECLSK